MKAALLSLVHPCGCPCTGMHTEELSAPPSKPGIKIPQQAIQNVLSICLSPRGRPATIVFTSHWDTVRRRKEGEEWSWASLLDKGHPTCTAGCLHQPLLFAKQQHSRQAPVCCRLKHVWQPAEDLAKASGWQTVPSQSRAVTGACSPSPDLSWMSSSNPALLFHAPESKASYLLPCYYHRYVA